MDYDLTLVLGAIEIPKQTKSRLFILILRYIINRRETKSLYVFKKSSNNNAQINAESKRFFTNFATER